MKTKKIIGKKTYDKIYLHSQLLYTRGWKNYFSNVASQLRLSKKKNDFFVPRSICQLGEIEIEDILIHWVPLIIRAFVFHPVSIVQRITCHKFQRYSKCTSGPWEIKTDFRLEISRKASYEQLCRNVITVKLYKDIARRSTHHLGNLNPNNTFLQIQKLVQMECSCDI